MFPARRANIIILKCCLQITGFAMHIITNALILSHILLNNCYFNKYGYAYYVIRFLQFD